MRDIEYAIHYNFCPNSTWSTVAAPLSPTGDEPTEPQSDNYHLRGTDIQHPCETLLYGPDQPPQDYDPVTGQATTTNANTNSHSSHRHSNNTTSHSNSNSSNSNNGGGGSEAVFDYNNPCATGGCLVSQGCGSGQCRLEQLGGRWVCCRCRRGGNAFRWCAHPMRRVPDTLCYHTVCLGCWADQDLGQAGA
ncbi:hypothetical protein PG999_003925 [Apiospora kogelbergensis]|uniref:Uncharacterized protein n=1 Tax=Apiospora kogelbergensis TaxID=1337665 RepID=A0AAW0R557_9PEZI